MLAAVVLLAICALAALRLRTLRKQRKLKDTTNARTIKVIGGCEESEEPEELDGREQLQESGTSSPTTSSPTNIDCSSESHAEAAKPEAAALISEASAAIRTSVAAPRPGAAIRAAAAARSAAVLKAAAAAAATKAVAPKDGKPRQPASVTQPSCEDYQDESEDESDDEDARLAREESMQLHVLRRRAEARRETRTRREIIEDSWRRADILLNQSATRNYTGDKSKDDGAQGSLIKQQAVAQVLNARRRERARLAGEEGEALTISASGDGLDAVTDSIRRANLTCGVIEPSDLVRKPALLSRTLSEDSNDASESPEMWLAMLVAPNTPTKAAPSSRARGGDASTNPCGLSRARSLGYLPQVPAATARPRTLAPLPGVVPAGSGLRVSHTPHGSAQLTERSWREQSLRQ